MHTAVSKILTNARTLGHSSQTAAFAIDLTTCHKAHSLCCWCAESVVGDAVRLPKGGECARCAYVGHDCLVVIHS